MLRVLARKALQKSPTLYALRQHLDVLPALLAGSSAANRSWSQHGEDTQLARELASSVADSFYVDVGANHPTRISNTYRLYRMGMRGLSIEPSESLCRLHARYRPGDVLFRGAVGTEDRPMVFYEMYPHMFSTFSPDQRKANLDRGIPLIREAIVPAYTLATLLECYAPTSRKSFGLLSVDTEGFDLLVLKSNDWERFRPKLVIAESNDESAARETSDYLASVGYGLSQKFDINGLFKDQRSPSAS